MFKYCSYVTGSYKLSTTTRQRPLSIHECLERPERSRSCWKPFLFISLLMPTIYYMFYYTSDPATDVEYLSESLQPDEMDFVNDTVTDSSIAEHTTMNSTKVHGIILYDGQVHLANRKRGQDAQKEATHESLRPCPVLVTGAMTVIKELNESVHINNLYPMVRMGGYYKPSDCRPKHKVAILVPYRDREENLRVFLYNIHPFLMRQKLEYRIFVFEQSGKELFNKGRIFNAGFLEIQRNDDWQCVIFHDVDLVPTDDRIRYTCPILPRHMCASVVEKEHIPHYNTIFGGVTAMTIWHYRRVNGYSNLYWGWGAEDDDMFRRLQASGLGVTAYKKNIARYVSLPHPVRHENKQRYKLLRFAENRYQHDGLSSVNYRILSYASHPLYTHIVVDIHPPVLPDYITEASMTFRI